MTLYWPEDKDPSDMDYFEVEIDDPWLGAEEIDSVAVEPDEGSQLQIGGIVALTGGVVRFQCGGGDAGTHRVLITITSQGRTLQRSAFIVVRES